MRTIVNLLYIGYIYKLGLKDSPTKQYIYLPQGIRMHRQFSEKTYVRAAQRVLSLSKDEFEMQFWQPDELNQKDGLKWDPKYYYKDVKTWCASIVHWAAKEGGDYISADLLYNFPLNQNCGRLHITKPSYGMQMLQSRMRSLFVAHLVKDVDMRNAHPTLLLYLCRKHDVDCMFLEAYVNKREHLLNKHNLNKRDVLVAINKDKPVPTSNAWFKNFQIEMVQIRNWFHENRHLFQGIVFGGNKDNPKASDLNRILSKTENEVLQLAVEKVGVSNVHTLMFDGFHLDNSAFHPGVIPMLDEATAEWGIRWSVKEFDQDVVIPEDFVFDYDKWVSNATDYDTVRMRLERNNARILEPACYVSRPDVGSSYNVCNAEQFKHKTSTFTIEKNDKGDMKTIHSDWMMDPDCRTYETLDFIPDPQMCPESTFNLFSGFPRRLTEERADTTILHEHLMDVVAAGDKEVYEYLLNDEALSVQKPCVQTRVAIVIKGGQGDGKDSYIDKRAALVGWKHVHRTANIQDLVGVFNGSMAQKLIYQLNELQGKDGFANKEALKHYITAERYDVNEKHKPVVSHGNYMRFFILSNNFSPIEISHDDRRFFVTKVSECWRGNKDKFEAFHAALRNPNVMDSYYTELMNRDVSAFEPRDRPMTAAYRSMQQACISDVFYVLRDAAEQGKLKHVGCVKSGRWYVTAGQFKGLYDSWRYDQGMSVGEYPRGLVLSKIRDIPGVCVDAKHRFEGTAAPARCYSFCLEALDAYMSGVFGFEG